MGKIKTYKANTNVSINVVLSNKKNLHISFSPLSNGTSTFTTDNEEVMNAIERHYNFGKLFRLHSMQGESDSPQKRVNKPSNKTANKNAAKTDADTANTGEEPAPTSSTDENGPEKAETTVQDNENADETQTDEPALKQVKVSDLAAAKDYLADKFGISRTALRSQKAIIEHAAANGIEFEGLE